ncbi:hypothetical protein BJY01DRAFT_256413 [Aspergillus pseudoustus]|uniref:Uncharacterized protein n=1 Tax=Aspergillus pseudoustus TaxID=1810923 RepID=A0ABR4IAF3_9EURO
MSDPSVYPIPSKHAPIGSYGLGFVEGPTGRLHKAAGEVLSIILCSHLIEVEPTTPSEQLTFKPAGIAHLKLLSWAARPRSGGDNYHGAGYILPHGNAPIVGAMRVGYWTDDEGCFRLGYGRVVKVWREFSVRIVDPFRAPEPSEEVVRRGFRKVGVFSEKGMCIGFSLFFLVTSNVGTYETPLHEIHLQLLFNSLTVHV